MEITETKNEEQKSLGQITKKTTQERIDTMMTNIKPGTSPDNAFRAYLDEDCFGVKNTSDLDVLVRTIYEIDLSDIEIKSASLQIAEFLQKFDSKNNNKIEDQKLFPYFISQIAKYADEMIKEKNSAGNQEERDLKEELGAIRTKLETMMDTINEDNKIQYKKAKLKADQAMEEKRQSEREIAESSYSEEALKGIIDKTLDEGKNFTIKTIEAIFNTTNTTDARVAMNNFSHLYPIISQYPLEQRLKLIELLPSLEDKFLYKNSLAYCLRTITYMASEHYSNVTNSIDNLILFCKTLENAGEKLKERFGMEVNNHAIFEIAIEIIRSTKFAQLEKDYDKMMSLYQKEKERIYESKTTTEEKEKNDATFNSIESQLFHKVMRQAKLAIELNQKGSEYDKHSEQKLREVVIDYKNHHTAYEIETNNNENDEESYPKIIGLAEKYLKTRFSENKQENLARIYELEQALIDAIEYRIDFKIYSEDMDNEKIIDEKDNEKKKRKRDQETNISSYCAQINMSSNSKAENEKDDEAIVDTIMNLEDVDDKETTQSQKRKKHKISEEKNDHENNNNSDTHLEKIRTIISSTISEDNFTQKTVETMLNLIKLDQKSEDLGTAHQRSVHNMRMISAIMSKYDLDKKIEMLNFIPSLGVELLSAESAGQVMYFFINLVTNNDLTTLCDNANNLKKFCGAVSSCTNKLGNNLKLLKIQTGKYELDQYNYQVISSALGNSDKFEKLKKEYSELSDQSDEDNSFFHAVMSFAKRINESLAPSRSAQNPNFAPVKELKREEGNRR